MSESQSVHQLVLESREDEPFIVNIYFDKNPPVQVWVGPADYPENNGDWWWVSPPGFDDDGVAIGAASGDVFTDWSAALCDFVMQAEIDLFHWPKWLDELEKQGE